MMSTNEEFIVQNPFSFSQGVFFKRETATPINQEARILDFVANLHAHALCSFLCTMHMYSVYYTMSPQGDFKI